MLVTEKGDEFVNVVCVCGLGMGSSLILKMSVEKALQELGFTASVEHQAAGTYFGPKPDMIVAAEDFRDELEGKDNVVFVTNVVKADLVKAEIRAFLEQKGLI